MFLRSSCSRNECEAPKGYENYSHRKQHRVARFTSSGVYIERSEADISALQANVPEHCCHHHHEDFPPDGSFSQFSRDEISPSPKVSKANYSCKTGRSSFSLRSCSHDSRSSCSRDSRRSCSYDSRISSSDTINYSYSESNDTMPIPDIMGDQFASQQLSSKYSNRLSSTPIINHQILSSSKSSKTLKFFKSKGIHDPDTGNSTLGAKYYIYLKRCYDYVAYWLEKASCLNTRAIVPSLKIFSTKKIMALFLLLLLLVAFGYMCQNDNHLFQLKSFLIHGANYLPKAFPFFILFHNNRNDLSRAPDIKDADNSPFISLWDYISPVIWHKKTEHILFHVDELDLSRDFNVSEIKLLVAKLVNQELDDLQLFKNWQDGKFFLRKEIDHIQKDFVEFKSEIKALLDPLKDIPKLSDRFESFETFSKQEEDKLNKKLGDMGKNIQKLNALNQITSTSYDDITLKMHTMERNIASFLKSPMKQTTVHPFRGQPFAEFIHTETQELQAAIVKTAITLQEMETSIEFLQSELKNIKSREANRYTMMDMEKMIKKAMLLYDADKTGQVDYALESAGGIVVKHSLSYMELSTVFGFRIWGCTSSAPRLAIKPSTYPGHCWAMKGSHGFIVIRLAHVIWPTGFVIEHAPKSIISPSNINSAPKAFTVYGLSSGDVTGTLLGNYSYDITGDPLQYFPVQFEGNLPFHSMELKIHSNYGNFNYTCLYRFRVHGIRDIREYFDKEKYIEN